VKKLLKGWLRVACVAAVGLGAVCVSTGRASEPPAVFPGKQWQRKGPAEVGLRPEKVEELVARLGVADDQENIPRMIFRDSPSGFGCIVKDGYLVRTWGDPEVKFKWYSSSKPVLTTLLFFAIRDGKVSGVDEPIARWGWGLRPEDRSMTFRHLANMISGYACAEGPGEAWAYNDFAIRLYALTLERVFGRSLNEAARHYFAPLQLQDGDLFHPRAHKGGGVVTTARDFARIGWFWLNRGNWAGCQLLPAEYFQLYMRPAVPGDMPRTRSEKPDDYLRIGTYGGGHNQTYDGPGIYGFTWWFNAPAGTSGRLAWPDGPRDAILTIGHGGNIMAMIPSHRLIVAARGNWGPLEPGRRSSRLNKTLRLIAEMVASPTSRPEKTNQP